MMVSPNLPVSRGKMLLLLLSFFLLSLPAIVGFFIMMLILLVWSVSDEWRDERRKVKQRLDALEELDLALWDVSRTVQRLERLAQNK